MLVISVVRAGVVCLIAKRGLMTTENDSLSIVYMADILSLINIVLLISLFVLAKAATQASQAYCPIFLGRVKQFGNARKRSGKQLFELLKKQQ